MPPRCSVGNRLWAASRSAQSTRHAREHKAGGLSLRRCYSRSRLYLHRACPYQVNLTSVWRRFETVFYSSENVQNILTVSTYFSVHQLRSKCESFLYELQTLSPSLTVNDLTENILAQNNNESTPPASTSNNNTEAINGGNDGCVAPAPAQGPYMTNECPSNSDITHLLEIIRTNHPPHTQPMQPNPLDSFLVPMQTIQLNDPENVRPNGAIK